MIGLQALSEFAPLVFSKDNKFEVKILTTNFTQGFRVNEYNMLVLQRVEVGTFLFVF